MAGKTLTSASASVPFVKNSGGLNSTASALDIADNEASDLKNIDFDRFGAFRKRNGYTHLNGITDDVFTGSGLSDITFSGSYSGSVDQAIYTVVIDATGAPDTFEWFREGVSQASAVSITGAAQLLNDGISVKFVKSICYLYKLSWCVGIACNPTIIQDSAVIPP